MVVVPRESVPGDVLHGLLGPARHVGFERQRYLHVFLVVEETE